MILGTKFAPKHTIFRSNMSKGDFATGNYLHCMKSVRIQSYSGQYFPVFGHFLHSVGIQKFDSYDENSLTKSKDLEEKISFEMFCKEKISYKMLRKLLELETKIPVSKS